MSNKNDGGPAFPVLEVTQDDIYQNIEIQHSGMTLRDYFAAKAMKGLIATGSFEYKGEISRNAYSMADAMLLERAK
jgi:hypothetical protein